MPSAMSRARAKFDPQVFRDLHREILARAPDRPLWKGRRVFDVEGAKVSLPPPLADAGYRTQGDHAHYPQSLVSCLYELMPRLPTYFVLRADTNERRAAVEHLRILSAGDVVVYDRGCFSYEMLHAHAVRGQDAVFRLKRAPNAETVAFLAGPLQETLVGIRPDDRARWRIEEMYKTAKWLMAVESFRSESQRGVLQELYANFVMVTATRLMTNEIDGEINASPDNKPPKRVKFTRPDLAG